MPILGSQFQRYDVFVDTTAFIALADKTEVENHKKAQDFIDQFIGKSNIQLVTSELVFAETAKHLQRMVWEKRLQQNRLEQFADWILNTSNFQILPLNESLRKRAWQICVEKLHYEVDLFDGTSLALIEHHGIQYAFSFDTHFDWSYTKGYSRIFVERYPK